MRKLSENCLKAFLALALCGLALAQTSVVLAPVPQQQFFSQSGVPLAFGCVFTYQSNTVTPLATYSDYTGAIQNANPIILSAGGTAQIWLQAGAAYTIVVKSSGGTNCSTGTTQYTVNGIGGGSTQNSAAITPVGGVATFNASAQNQLFTLTLTANTTSNPLTTAGVVAPAFVTFQISQDGVGSHTFAWPANVIGGATVGANASQVTTQTFLWNGTNAYAIGPGMEGSGPLVAIGTLSISTSIVAPAFISSSANAAASGIFRLASGDSMKWRNNANSADVALAKDTSDNLNWPNGLTLGGGTALATTNQSGSGSLCMTTGCAMTSPTMTTPNIGQATATSVACALATKTGAYVLAATDCFIQANAASGGFQISIAHAITGQMWTITRTDSTTANSVTLAGDSGNINGGASLKLQTGQTAVCHADGTNSWCTVSTNPNTNTLVQSTRLTASATTFTYPVAYSSTPTCVCAGEGGSCNVSSVSVSACTLNITVATNDVIVSGNP